MVNPAAGAGGALIAVCIFIVAPVALLLHACTKRYFLVSISIALVNFAFWFGLWIWLDVLDPNAKDRMWRSLPLVMAHLWMPLLVSATIGLPFLFIRYLRNRNATVR